MADSTPIVNPDTPLAFLDPETAYQTSVAVYVLAGSLGVLIWDVLDNITADYRLLFKSRITLSTAAYFGSRALLFFFRLRAIYNKNNIIVGCFFVLWLGLLACTILIPVGILGGTIGPTKYCVDADVPNSAYAAIIAPLVHDTLVFIAISWRLIQNAHMDAGFKGGVQVALFGKSLPAFSRGLLLDGQRYYLITLISNLVTVVMVFDTSVPIPMRSMCATPNIVLTNIMACRVYRRTKAGLFRESEISTTNMSAKNRLPVAVYTSRTKASDTPYRVDIDDLTKTYDAAAESKTVEDANNYPKSFVDIEKAPRNSE
ncbi:hypothetical protein BJ912DRAFT_950733 [Pholiota molesta]|nr:hypothetical protein BJ912DRAFT_950733 [Pholiota molesta]